MNATEETIFNAALDKRDRNERSAYLDQACAGDAALRSRIEQLVSAYDEGAFLELPAAGLTVTIHQHPVEKTGTMIGPYKLLQQIGEGGMGVVYMAEQTAPVQRHVALKIIKPGMDSRQVIGRFEAERQALALMDHPNIARVLDAGTTQSGRPYFVMELIKGIPITKYCDEKHLSLRERLELLIPVCQAIQHAHQKGIIHRDIKPTNVLIAQYDGRPVPKVIDFGVAKATAQKLTERTMFTELGQIVGTLEYMSPEQAELNQLDIDTRSDIYSLGVLLYELLTGSTPFDKQKLRTAAFAEMLRIIREDEPEKPSTRLSRVGSAHQNSRRVGVSPAHPIDNHNATSTDTNPHTDTSHDAEHNPLYSSLASIAAVRSTEPARLTESLRGELDWIVMKALDKERSRRYETANGFALDLQRYLDDEQVHACPPSAGYRFRKFARRNKVAMTTAALVALALVAGTAVSTWQAIRATQAEVIAEANAALARRQEQNAKSEEQKAIASAKAEATQRQRAEEQAQQLEKQSRLLENNQRVHALVTDQILSVLSTVSSDDAKRRQLLVAAMAGLGDLDTKERIAAYRRMGNLLMSAGQFSEAFSAFKEGLNLDPHDAATYISRGDSHFRRRDFQKAAADYSAAIENRPASDSANVTDVPYCRRGIAWYRLRKFDQALADFRSSYDALPKPTMQFLGRQFNGGGGEIFSSKVNEQIRDGFLALVDRQFEDSGKSITARTTRATYLALFGQFDRAEAEVETILKANSTSYFSYYQLALLALRRGDLTLYRQICQTMIDKFGNDSDRDRRYVVLLVCSLAPQSLDDYTTAIAIARRGITEQPTSTTAQFALGSILLRAGQYAEARKHLESIKQRYDSEGTQCYSPFLVAVACHKLGQQDDAIQRLHAAQQQAKQPRSAGMNWRFLAILDQFEKEAKQLIEPPSSGDEQATE